MAGDQPLRHPCCRRLRYDLQASKVQAAVDLRRKLLVPAAKRGSVVKPARPGSAAMGPENKVRTSTEIVARLFCMPTRM